MTRFSISFLLTAMWISLFALETVAQSPSHFNFGFSPSTIQGVNQTDLMAMSRIWSDAFIDSAGFPVRPIMHIFSGIDEIRKNLENKTVDYMLLTAEEYAELRGFLANDTMMLGIVSGSATEEYLLLAPRNSGIEGIDDLYGRSLRLLSTPRTSLASIWLDTLFLQKRSVLAKDFLGIVETNIKIANVVLPVFFGKADACVVTRKGFDTMVELNPQVGKKLQIIAVSPLLMPEAFCSARHVEPSLREQLSTGLKTWHTTLSGQQTLTLFQTDRIEQHPMGIMKPTLDFLADHKRLLGTRVK